MIEPAITVVFCRACRHSERLTLTDGRFWCAWCQRWAEIDVEHVSGANLVLDGGHFRLAPAAQREEWMQPLRIPSGWLIGWNSFAEEDIDPTSNGYPGECNLFLATNERMRLALDIEWRTDPDQPATGRYLLRVLPLVDIVPEERLRRHQSEPLGVDWDNPAHTFETTSRIALVAELEACLRGERG